MNVGETLTVRSSGLKEEEVIPTSGERIESRCVIGWITVSAVTLKVPAEDVGYNQFSQSIEAQNRGANR
jgi:hypothetical protein